jgi:hypothetical protein
MAYYDALISGWNLSSGAAGALPAGVTGTSLYGLTTNEKLVNVNAWTVQLTVATATMSVYDIVNCITPADAPGLTALQLQQLSFLLGPPSGSITTSASSNIAKNITAILTGKTTTLANLNTLFNESVISKEAWATTKVADGGAGLSSQVTHNDLEAAGLS